MLAVLLASDCSTRAQQLEVELVCLVADGATSLQEGGLESAH